MPTIQIPYQFKPRDYQLEYLTSNKRFKICVWHRRSGKSKTALNEQIRKAQITKGVYYYFLPTYRQAKQVIWDSLIKEHLPAEIVEKVNDSELAIYYKNGSIQRFAGCEDIDKHRGINPLDVVFDEYSEEREELWTAVIQPVLRENKGTATFIYTPKGKNHSWKLLEQAKDNSEWFWSVKTVDDTSVIDPQEMEAIKKTTPQALIDQEYYCNFLEGADAFFRKYKDNLYLADDKPEDGHKYVMGVDLAKYQDYTVITVIDLNTFRVKKQERFNQIDYITQKAMIEATYLRYNKPLVRIDSTGVGEPIFEDLANKGINIEPYKFTEASRKDLLTNLSLLLEQGKLYLPNEDTLIRELESFRMGLTDKGRMTITVPEGLHDDCVFSLALAAWQLPINPQPLIKSGIAQFLTAPKDKIEITRYD